MDERYDAELLEHGDKRNVVDKYRMMTVEAIKADLDTSRHSIHIAIENFQHDFNIGTIVRNANAFNVAAVHIIGRRHWNRRGAMATDKYMNIYQHKTIDEFIDAIPAGYSCIGVDNVQGSVELGQVELPKKAVFVFGGEGPGLSSDMKARCSQLIAIEQFGSTRSVNVGVASGIVMYEWVRRNILKT